MFYDPIKVALLGIAAWIVIWLITPVYVTGYVSLGALSYIAICYLGLFIGAMLARRGTSNVKYQPPTQWNIPFHENAFKITAAIGLFGMAMRVFDRTVLRGVGYGGDALLVREALEQVAVTPVGAIAAVLFCFCFIPLLILLASDQKKHRLKLLVFSGVLFSLPMAESLLQLSRSTLLLTLGMAFISLVITRYGGRPVNRKLIVFSIGSVVLLSVFSSIIFSARLDASGRTLDDSVYTSVYPDFLQPNQRATKAIFSSNKIESSIYNIALPNGMYYISGLYEITALWDRPDRQPFGSGQIIFSPIFRGFQVLTGSGSAFDAGNYVYRVGTWQTFFGPVWSDFGWIGPMFLMLIGYSSQSLSNGVRQRRISDFPIYAYLMVIILFMPVVNLISNGLGLFAIASFLIFRSRMSKMLAPTS